MSYEGYEQVLCENGHLEVRDDSSPISMYEGEILEELCFCGAKRVFFNAVDQTNGEDWGYIDFEQFLITAANRCECPTCGNGHMVGHNIYKIPTKEEVEKARTYRDDYNGGRVRYCHNDELVGSEP